MWNQFQFAPHSDVLLLLYCLLLVVAHFPVTASFLLCRRAGVEGGNSRGGWRNDVVADYSQFQTFILRCFTSRRPPFFCSVVLAKI